MREKAHSLSCKFISLNHVRPHSKTRMRVNHENDVQVRHIQWPRHHYLIIQCTTVKASSHCWSKRALKSFKWNMLLIQAAERHIMSLFYSPTYNFFDLYFKILQPRYGMENFIPVQTSNFLTHQPNEPSGNMALHSSGNAYKAIPLLTNS